MTDLSPYLFAGRALPGEFPASAVYQETDVIRGGANAPQLAQRPVDMRASHDLSGEWEAEIKMDGICCLMIDGRLVTLQGTPYDGATHVLPLLREMEKLAGGALFLHGEMVEPGGFDATLGVFRSGRGGHGTLWLHDMTPLEEWRTGKPCTIGRRYRRLEMRRLIEQIDSPYLGFIKAQPVTMHTVGAFEERIFAAGAEGYVLKRPDGFYHRAKHEDWIRVKQTFTSEMTVMDVIDNAGTIRALLCRDSDGRTVTVRHGVENISPDDAGLMIMGSRPIVEVAGFVRVGAKNGDAPMFMRVRHDKTGAL